MGSWIVNLWMAEQLGKIARHNGWDRDFPRPIHRIKIKSVKRKRR